MLGKGKNMELKDFDVDRIIIATTFKQTPPKAKKLERARRKYLESGILQENIVINDRNVLIDGYITYILAIENGIAKMNANRGYAEIVEAIHWPGNTKRYKWSVPRWLVGDLAVGDEVIALTSKGAKRVKIVNIIRKQFPEQGLRDVYKKCKGVRWDGGKDQDIIYQ